MGSNTKLNRDLIKEVLADIFLKITIVDNPISIICYNRDNLLSIRPQSSSESINKSLRKSLKLEREDIKAKKEPHRNKPNSKCNFCRKIGHIKRTCLKNKAFINSTQKLPQILQHEPRISKSC